MSPRTKVGSEVFPLPSPGQVSEVSSQEHHVLTQKQCSDSHNAQDIPFSGCKRLPPAWQARRSNTLHLRISAAPSLVILWRQESHPLLLTGKGNESC